jgi:hypothetical protein
VTLGIALLLIFILYLIDKHNRWRQAVKLVIGFVVLGLLGLGGLYSWQKYDEYRTQQEQAAYELKMKPFSDCVARNSQFSNASEECEKDPAVLLHPIQPANLPAPIPLVSSPKPKSRSALGWAVVADDFTDIYKRCYFNTGSLPCGIDETTVAMLHKGDRIRLLTRETRSSDGNEIYEVQFQQWTGWIEAGHISLQ